MNKIKTVCFLSSILISGQLWASSLQTSNAVNHSAPKTTIQSTESTRIQSFDINPYGKLDDLNTTMQPEARTMDFDQNPFIYGSGYYDTESNLQYMGARYYSADIGRFMAQDSYDLINRYNYANANPIMNIDPDGHLAWGFLPDSLGGWIGFAAGGFASLVSGGLIGALGSLSVASSITAGAVAGAGIGAVSHEAAIAVDKSKSQNGLISSVVFGAIAGAISGGVGYLARSEAVDVIAEEKFPKTGSRRSYIEHNRTKIDGNKFNLEQDSVKIGSRRSYLEHKIDGNKFNLGQDNINTYNERLDNLNFLEHKNLRTPDESVDGSFFNRSVDDANVSNFSVSVDNAICANSIVRGGLVFRNFHHGIML